MATRFYFPSSGTPPLSALDRDSGVWTLPSGSLDPEVSRLPLVRTKTNTSLTTTTKTWPDTSSNSWCLFQFQSEPLAFDYSFVSSFISVVIGKCIEATTSTDTFLEVVVRAVSYDGSVDRGVIVDMVSNEFPITNAATRRISTNANAVDTFAGDRLVVEVGVFGSTPTTSNYSIRLGDPSAVADFAWTDGLTTDLCSWVESTLNLQFADVALVGSGTQRRQEGAGTLTFSAAADVFIDGAGTQRRQDGAGTLTFSGMVLRGTGSQRRQDGAGTLSFADVAERLIGHGTQRRALGFGGLSLDDSILIYGAGTQRRQSGIGTLFSPISGEAGALLDAGIRFVLTIDGDIYPLIGAIIKRHRNYEQASVTIPGAITWAILATVPTDLAIDLSRLRLDGSAIETVNMFTGVIDLSLASLNGLTGELVANGSAIYPTRENRRLSGSPSYIRDSADQVAVRGQIDPYLVPGDVLRFSDVREIAVSKIVFNINPNLMFMEASSGI